MNKNCVDQLLKGGVIMDVTCVKEAKIAQEAGSSCYGFRKSSIRYS